MEPDLLATNVPVRLAKIRLRVAWAMAQWHGAKSSSQREPGVPAELLRALFGNVTEPYIFVWK
jgi:hypothetical protein